MGTKKAKILPRSCFATSHNVLLKNGFESVESQAEKGKINAYLFNFTASALLFPFLS